MKRIVLAWTAIFFLPLLSGCCCCGTSTSCGGYNSCLPYGGSYSQGSYAQGNYGVSGGGDCNCQGGDNFSLPPVGTTYPMQSSPLQSGAMQTVGPDGTIYGPEVMGPEIVGPQYVPNGTEWQQAAPPVPVTPATPGNMNSGSNALMPPAPIPGVSNGSVVVPSPSPFSPASTMTNAGPMVPQVPPPPPEPVSQMRFRQYR